jgi:hypothetical protein
MDPVAGGRARAVLRAEKGGGAAAEFVGWRIHAHVGADLSKASAALWRGKLGGPRPTEIPEIYTCTLMRKGEKRWTKES